MGRIVNLFGGPGSGKSITACALFAELKYRGHNIEYVPEYAKDAVWEGRGAKFFAAQSHIYGEQSFRIDRVIDDVEFVITDSPLLMSSLYVDETKQPALIEAIYEHHLASESVNIFIEPTMPYQQDGRYQTPDQAMTMHERIQLLLCDRRVDHLTLLMNRETPAAIIDILEREGWV